MSALPEREPRLGAPAEFEQRSKFKLIRNAKGDPQWEISVVAGDTREQLDAARAVAVAQWQELEKELVSS